MNDRDAIVMSGLHRLAGSRADAAGAAAEGD